ncbi:hypothetical protein F2Q70_00004034 [Brassica cretica]|uniref:Uncharacterized protein n=1 Tax=Brassica cretica TaxID=69181 RepID=A0A8S9IRE3_BRACR|nr:hypothetical protein F2Q70_00004034 [Brassica cretica]
MGELNGLLGPTREMGELDGLLGRTRQMGELDGLLDLILPFGKRLPPSLVVIALSLVAPVCNAGTLHQRWSFWITQSIPRSATLTRQLGANESILGPKAGVVAESPPDGYFTCFEVYLMQCHLWFPLLEIIVRFFSRFGFGFGQITPVGLQHIIGKYRISPWPNKTIKVDFVNYRVWTQPFFFVRIDNASMEESCIPDLRTALGRREINPLPPVPEGLTTIISLLSSGDFYYEFTKASRLVNGGLLVMNQALDASIQEARMAQFRAEKAAKEIARVRDERESSRRDEGSFMATEIHRAHRRGRREMAEVMKTRRDQFSNEFGELKEGYKAYGNYRDCPGTVGGLFLTQAADYSYDVENARHTRRMNERAGRFRDSPVNQPVVPITVDDYLVGESITGYFDVDC